VNKCCDKIRESGGNSIKRLKTLAYHEGRRRGDKKASAEGKREDWEKKRKLSLTSMCRQKSGHQRTRVDKAPRSVIFAHKKKYHKTARRRLCAWGSHDAHYRSERLGEGNTILGKKGRGGRGARGEGKFQQRVPVPRKNISLEGEKPENNVHD